MAEKKLAYWLRWVIAAAFALQSLAVSFAMINKTLTIPFLIPGITVVAGWITLSLIIIGILGLLVHAIKGKS